MKLSKKLLLTIVFMVGFVAYLGALRAAIKDDEQVKESIAILPVAKPNESPGQPQAQRVPQTLSDAYQAALEKSETIDIQRELLIQSDEGNAQAIGALLPNVSATMTALNQPTPASVTGASISPSNQTTTTVTADQPIFRGFRDFATLRQKKNLIGAQVNSLLNAAKQLFYDLSLAYYNVLSYEEDKKNYQIEIQVNRTRLKELEEFYKIGRSQLTDVLTFKANIASLEAQLAVTVGQLETAKEVLAYLTGWNRSVLLEDKEQAMTHLEPVEAYLEKLEQRADVKSAIENVNAYAEGVPIAWGQHLPNADVIGDYYLQRPGVLSDVNWDVKLVLSLPIFSGGVVQSQVRQANSVARQYISTLSQTRRTAEQEIRTFYDTLSADTNQLQKLAELVEVSKENSETEVKYYRNGLVTNLDVLTAITTYQDAKRQLDHQKYTVRLDSVKLQASIGQRKELDVKLRK
jgi:outer membrane protein